MIRGWKGNHRPSGITDLRFTLILEIFIFKGKKVKVKRTCIAPFVKLQRKALRYGSHSGMDQV